MSAWTWITSIYLLGLTAASFYSVYLMDQAKGLYDEDLMFVGRNSNNAQQEGLMIKTRAAVTFFKYLTYTIIVLNAVAIISFFLGDIKLAWRTPSAVGGRR
jgi:hypothetical protein